MKKIGAILLLALSPFAIDSDTYNGAWAMVAGERPESNHAYFRIDERNEGRFVFVAEGKSIVDFEFSTDDVTEPAGYIEVSKSFGDWGMKVVLSGWVSEEDGGLGMLTGIAYMYQLLDGRPQIFNSHFLRLNAIAGPMPSQDGDADTLIEIHKLYGSPEP